MNGACRRFVHVFATLGAGGPQVRALQLMQHLGAGFRHVVMAMDGCTEALGMVPPEVEVAVEPPPPRRGFVGNVRAARAWLAAQRPDLVLTYNWGAIESAVAARSLGLPLVHHEDGFLPDEASRRLRRRSWLRRLALRDVPVVVPSTVLRRIATEEWRLRRVHHLPNGVDLERFRPAPPPQAFVAGAVGGLRAEKDQTTLLRAFAELPVEARLCLVGGGPLAGDLRAEAARLGVGDRVEFVGAVQDTAPCYARMSAFVLSSRTEQMPIALLEAMASGLPVAATDVGDVRAILPDEAGDLVVPPGDARALAAALRRLLGDASLRVRLGASNRRRVEERYDARSCLGRFAAVYEATLRAPS
jgi:glycosyltransferase involved in cell wall biosynthesis